ncbi:MAG TPA: hypothetical protein VF481_07875 [Novosphingobium sp.]
MKDFDYLITSAPGECPFDIGAVVNPTRIEMSPRGQWLMITGKDALLIVMDDAPGLNQTGNPDLFEFTGNRPNFDNWMAARHPLITYGWLDQFALGFADHASRQSFDDDLGQRVLRSAHLRRTV